MASIFNEHYPISLDNAGKKYSFIPKFDFKRKRIGCQPFPLLHRLLLLYRIYIGVAGFYRIDSWDSRKDLGDLEMKPDKDFNLIVGLRIREIREAFGMTRDGFSEKCDISASFLTDVENGKKAVSSRTLFKICTATNMSADYFIRGHQNGFESDMVIELINRMPKHAKDGAIRILREYAGVVQDFIKQSDSINKP